MKSHNTISLVCNHSSKASLFLWPWHCHIHSLTHSLFSFVQVHDSCQKLHKYTLSLNIKLLYQYQNSFTPFQDSTHQFLIEILLIYPFFLSLIQLAHLQQTSHTIHPSNSPPVISNVLITLINKLQLLLVYTRMLITL